VAEEIQGRSLILLHWKIKYRFTQEPPRPQEWYVFQAETSAVSMKEVQGKDLKAEGVIEEKSGIYKTHQLPTSVKFSVLHGISKGKYRKISNDLDCPVKNPTGVVPDPPKATAEQNKIIVRLTTLGAEVQRFGGPDGSAVAISFHSKKVGDAALADLPKLTHLLTLEIDSSGATDAGLAYLKDMTSLKVLSFGSNPAITDAGLAHLKGLTQLQQIMFSYTGITDGGLVHLKGMDMLEQVYAGCRNVGDVGLAHLQALPNLRSLALADSQVTDAGMAHIKEMKKLEFLALDRTQVSDAGLAQLKGLTKLVTLRVVGTKVTDAGVGDLRTALPNVKVVQKD
jgi:hypothetical protein